MSLPKTYVAKSYESDIYKRWEDSDAFSPREGKGEPFSIVLPPPNATGTLHLGHAIMIAIEDVQVRYARMNGRETVWVPGTDHAAIATENVVIKQLQDQGVDKPREELGREKLIEEIKKFVENSRDTIRNQTKAMGASVDWSRERYTMEPAMQTVIEKLFIKMYHDGLIYRGHRIVNWDPNLETTVSDDEVQYEERQTNFYTFQYGPFQIATSRPETKFGDKYVVMHPNDDRYRDYEHGQEIELEWINGPITTTVIKDESIDPEFGTGVMTITPWHDRTDFEIAERHELQMEPIIGKDGRLLEIAGRFKGQTIEEARKGVVALLDEKGLLVDTDSGYRNQVGIAERGGGTIEPQVMEQWFVDVNKEVIDWQDEQMSLKQIMQSVVRDEDIEILPHKFKAVYFNWIDNLRDWCISRQIWWGHRIPAWYRDNELFVGHQPPPDDGQGEWQQDPDTLDTWFSSGTWTWSTLLDPELATDDISLEELMEQSGDFQKFHPTSLLETGYDIIFFWVARMILMTTYATGEIPFEDVYLHGMVRTRDGQKMSKSLPETAIDPLEMIEKYGADALRLSMLVGLSPGNDIKLYEEKIAGYRNFCNKLWNVGRFILENCPKEARKLGHVKITTPADAWISKKLNQAIDDISADLDDYHISQAGEELYHLLWDDFADWYIEASKSELNRALLVENFRTILKLTHPLAPYLTEVLWQHFAPDDEMLITTAWPTASKHKIDQDLVDEFEQLRSVVNEIRELSNDIDLTSTVLYHQPDDFLEKHAPLIKQLTAIPEIKEVSDGRGLKLRSLNLSAWLDISQEVGRSHLMRLIKQRDNQQQLTERLEAKLDNDSYVDNAPVEIVEETRQQLRDAKELAQQLESQIENVEQLIV